MSEVPGDGLQGVSYKVLIDLEERSGLLFNPLRPFLSVNQKR